MGKRKRGSKNRPLTHEEIWDDSALIESWEAAAEEYKLYRGIQAKGESLEDAIREHEANEAEKAAEEATGAGPAATTQDGGVNAHHSQEVALDGQSLESMREDEEPPPTIQVRGCHMLEHFTPFSGCFPPVAHSILCLMHVKIAFAHGGPQQEPMPKRLRKERDQEGTEQTEASQMPSLFTSIPREVLGAADGFNGQEDEGLKNLMTAWYFAGYYTGLYEGQRRARTPQQD
ncbi:hypothetical protein LOZ65_006169 [Ophidiomyces ophidiicola]|nr:hypothetical protein LOZ65_006169 [Ophidiomyces ophidiicola]